MYSILIVDDNNHDIQKVKTIINRNCNEISLDYLYTANNIQQAKEMLLNRKIDILLCDIEMPQGTGIELLEWGQEQNQDIISVLLTCHSDFKYARQALRLGCIDYLLKPVEPEELISVLKKADVMLKKKKESIRIEDYQQMWKRITPLVMESFWLNIINNTELSSENAIKEMVEEMNLPITMDMSFFPILFTIQRYHKELSSRNQKIIEHVIKQSIYRIFTKEEFSTQIIKLNNMDYIIILSSEHPEQISTETLREKCDDLVCTCNEVYCDVSCFIGEMSRVADFSNVVAFLKALKNENVLLNQVVEIHEADKKAEVISPNIDLWATLLKKGKYKEATDEIFVYLKVLSRTGNINASMLKQFLRDFLQMILMLLNQNNISASEIFNDSVTAKLEDKAVCSIEEMGIWVKHIIRKTMERINAIERPNDVIEAVKEYIALHLDEEDLSRDTIAQHTFLSPDYLSKLFKKRTGFSISDYLIHERFKKAKELLLSTDLSVSTVASAVGYSHFSHFSKMFKKIAGCTPIEYRKKYKPQL